MYRRLFVFACALALAGCPSEPTVEPPTPDPNLEPEWPAMSPGALEAGASTGYLDLPVGLPLAGFTGRDNAFGSDPGADTRTSDYTTDFQASAGWQTTSPVQAIWLTDGERHSVIVRLDLIYSWDELTEEIGRRLSDATGFDLTDSVFTITSHSHSSPGTFTNATMFFLGSDVFSAEIYGRIVDDAVEHALAAWESRVPAKAGLGIDLEFDPIGTDVIFRDRREENDHLLGAQGQPTGEGWKDQRASMLRVDSLDDEPIAALFAFGIHGTIMGGDNTLASIDAPGHIGLLMQERYPGPVWMFGQGAGGDASPAGRHSGFARAEHLAEQAAEHILSLYESIELSADPVILEPLHRYAPQNRDSLKVTRNGTELLEYEPWDPSWVEFPPFADENIYDDDGNVLSPLDEFWAEVGAALCGDPVLNLPTLGLDVEHFAYKSCIRMDSAYVVFRIAFPEYFEERETSFQLPLPSTKTAMIGALGIQGLSVTTVGTGPAETAAKDVVFAFAPGEPTTLWTQFLRERAATEKGVEEVVLIGYAMDHEGYLLLVEDWLLAGYEPSITVWGPLQGEAILERMLDLLPLATTPVAEDENWPDWPGETVYLERSIPTVVPDPSPQAGTSPTTAPEFTFVRPGASVPAQGQPDASARRMQDTVQFMFWGNDPAMGNPTVEIEREDAGGWEVLRTPAGNPIDDALPDILVTYTPLPLAGTVDEPDPEREHLYVAEWQAVDSWGGREGVPGLALGQYRFSVRGMSRDPADTDYPFDGLPWSATS
ncbi:MAG: neutral/alkaline non-lysosomal ceramidase N-terminal domain-containing protein, partial [Deltaproteobacteria bacterium]|nr:neutral/alkaline non-lysosomal ceramidase N-terminal domain-containing protein [Deltaproteobacteria bacterium]